MNQVTKIYYRKNCKFVNQVIKEAKYMLNNKQILEADNKIKAFWKIVENKTDKIVNSTFSIFRLSDILLYNS
jgi:hypothetical protein